MIRVGWFTALILSTLGVLLLLWQFREAVVLFLLSLALAAAIHPIKEAFQRRGIRKPIALVLSFSIVLLVLVALVLLTSGPLITDLRQATNDSLVGYEWIRTHWEVSQSPLFSSFANRMPSIQTLYEALAGEGSSQILQTVFGAAQGLFRFLAHVAIILIMSIYWSVDQVRFERLWLSLLPVERRTQARSIWLAIESGVGAAICREVTLSIVGGVCLWLGYLVLGMNYAALLAFLAAIARLIPWFGPMLVVVVAFFSGYGQSWQLGLAAAGYSLLVLVLLETVIGSRIFPRQRYGSLLLVLLVIVMADSFGVAGAILAPILAVAVQILLKNLLPAYSPSTNDLSTNTLTNLQSKLCEIRQVAESLGDNGAAESTNLISRLETLLEKTRQFYSGD